LDWKNFRKKLSRLDFGVLSWHLTGGTEESCEEPPHFEQQQQPRLAAPSRHEAAPIVYSLSTNIHLLPGVRHHFVRAADIQFI
jgi:hypothetical protein